MHKKYSYNVGCSWSSYILEQPVSVILKIILLTKFEKKCLESKLMQVRWILHKSNLIMLVDKEQTINDFWNIIHLNLKSGMCKVQRSLLFAKSRKVKYGAIYFVAKVKVK